MQKSNAYPLPLEGMRNPPHSLDADYGGYPGCTITHSIILNELYKCSNIPTNANILKSILTNGKTVVQHI